MRGLSSSAAGPGDRLARLAGFLTIGSSGKAGASAQEHPYILPGDSAREQTVHFLQVVDPDWVRPGFDWMQWQQQPEGSALMSDPARLMGASEDQLEKVITTLVRQERYCNGGIEQAWQSGLIKALVQRAREILRERTLAQPSASVG